jgi:hypothetical protein
MAAERGIYATTAVAAAERGIYAAAAAAAAEGQLYIANHSIKGISI